MRTKSPFLESIRRTMRLRGYSLCTEKTYLVWIRSFIRFHKNRHPREMGADEVVAYLDHLAFERHVTTNTQKVVINALGFLYNKYLNQPLGKLGFRHTIKPRQLPTVLNIDEMIAIFEELKGVHRLIFQSV